MRGDQYQIFSNQNNHTVLHETVDDWGRAKELRGSIFDQNPKARAVWIMRSNPSLNLQPERFGFTLRRTRHEVA